MRTIETGDLLLTENAELEVREDHDESFEVVDEHNDHFAVAHTVAYRNLRKGNWELRKSVRNQ